MYNPMMMRDFAMRRDGRNPYGSRGGYVTSRDPRRRDRAMGMEDYARGREMGDYNYGNNDMARSRNRMGQYTSDRGMYPFEVSGEFEMHDRHHYDPYMMGDYGNGMYDMARGGRDYGYDYGYDEPLTREELEHWCKKMMSELDEGEKQMLSKDAILQKARGMGIEFKGFNEMEYYVNVIKNYTDHKKSIGENPDMAMKLARDDFFDEDGRYKGSEWLAVYFDTFVK